jgi:AcrR family transcriptional regulator
MAGEVRSGPHDGTARGRSTRSRLLDAAEVLFLERGVDNVSISQIRQAAGQRNASAVHFHFGDREGLLRALADRHMPRLAEMQAAVYERATADGEPDDRSLVEVMVGPLADYVVESPSARAWIVMSAELAARPERRRSDFTDGAPRAGLLAAAEVLERLSTTMPRRRAVDRLIAVLLASLHLCADRARHLETADPDDGRRLTSHAEFRTDLVDLAVGALTAPATTPTGSDHPPRSNRA